MTSALAIVGAVTGFVSNGSLEEKDCESAAYSGGAGEVVPDIGAAGPKGLRCAIDNEMKVQRHTSTSNLLVIMIPPSRVGTERVVPVIPAVQSTPCLPQGRCRDTHRRWWCLKESQKPGYRTFKTGGESISRRCSSADTTTATVAHY